MGIRDYIEKNQKTMAVAAGLLIVIAVGYSVLSNRTGSGVVANPNIWFTVDDGATFFADDRTMVPPVDRDGKTLYGCEVIADKSGVNRKVNYLYRYTSAVRDRVLRAYSNPVQTDPRFEVAETLRLWDEINRDGQELKAPNDPAAKWVKANSREGSALKQIPKGMVAISP